MHANLKYYIKAIWLSFKSSSLRILLQFEIGVTWSHPSGLTMISNTRDRIYTMSSCWIFYLLKIEYSRQDIHTSTIMSKLINSFTYETKLQQCALCNRLVIIDTITYIYSIEYRLIYTCQNCYLFGFHSNFIYSILIVISVMNTYSLDKLLFRQYSTFLFLRFVLFFFLSFKFSTHSYLPVHLIAQKIQLTHKG